MLEMNIGKILDEKVVRDFRRLFYQITGLCTSFWFPGWNSGRVDFVPRSAKSRFCQLIQSCPKGLAKCTRDDGIMIEEIQSRLEPVTHTCYAGLTGVGLPVLFGDKIIGIVFAGDISTRQPTKAEFLRLRKKIGDLDIDFAELEDAYFSLPVISRRTVRITTELLSLMVNYIVGREQNAYLQETIFELQGNIYERQKQLLETLSQEIQPDRSLLEDMEMVRRFRDGLLKTTSPANTGILTEDDGTRRSRIVKQAMEFIDTYYTEEVTLKEVAEHVGLSTSYLSLIFHKESGSTFLQYLTRKRVDKACELLQDLHLNVTEVSMRVGYYNTNYFNDVFKRIVGLTPGKYRDRIEPK